MSQCCHQFKYISCQQLDIQLAGGYSLLTYIQLHALYLLDDARTYVQLDELI